MSKDLPPSDGPCVRFVPEKTAETDAFGAKKTAQTIALAIAYNEHLKTIGLLGPWGSGKSTTVSFIADALKDVAGDESLLFTYDAWMFQSDAPRRAFIEALFKFLEDQGRVRRADWDDDLAQLTGQLEVSVTSDRPFTTWTSRLMLVGTLGAPLAGVILARKAQVEQMLPDLNDEHLGWLCGALVVLPIGIWAVAQIIRVTWLSISQSLGWPIYGMAKLAHGRKPPWLHFTLAKLSRFLIRRPDNAAQAWPPRFKPKRAHDWWSWITFKKPTTVERRKSTTPTPTTLEFQAMFRRLAAAATAPNDKNGLRPRLLVAVDNLDRLPPAEAVALWSVIRSFFLGPHVEDTERVTVLLPMDEAYVAHIQGEQPMKAAPAAADGDATRARAALAAGLMEKTFDLTLRLTQPAFVDWQQYFRDQLNWAFSSQLHSDELHDIVALLKDYWSDRDLSAITPRSINSMVNRIVATWLRWADEKIPRLTIAFYAIRQDDIDADLRGALSKDYRLVGADADWKVAVAAMHYGLDLDQAENIVLAKPLEQAIARHDSDAFISLATNRGFTSVMTDLIEAFDETTTDATVLQAADLLREVPIHGDRSLWQLENALRRAFLASSASQHLHREHAPYLCALAEGGLPTLRIQLINALAARLTPETGEWDSDALHCLDDVLTYFPDPFNDTDNGLTVPSHLKTFVKIVALVQDRHSPWLHWLIPSDPPNVVKQIAAAMERGEQVDDALDAMVDTQFSFDWTQVIEFLSQVLGGRPQRVPFSTALFALGRLRKTHPRAADLLEIHRSGRVVVHLLDQAFDAHDETFAGRAMAIELLSPQPMLENRPWTTDTVPGFSDAFVQVTATMMWVFGRPEEYSVERLDGLATQRPFLSGIITRLIPLLAPHSDDSDLSELIGRLPFYQDHASHDDLVPLLRYLHSKDYFWTAFATVPDESAAALLAILRNQEIAIDLEVDLQVAKRLFARDPNDLVAAILKNTEVFSLIRIASDGNLDLPSLLDAVLHTKDQLPSRPDAVHRWAIVVGTLAPPLQAEAMNAVVSLLQDPEAAGIAGALWLQICPPLDHPDLRERDDVLLRVVHGLLALPADANLILASASDLIPLILTASDAVRRKVSEALQAATHISDKRSLVRLLSGLWADMLTLPTK